jgi:hypothetical protein
MIVTHQLRREPKELSHLTSARKGVSSNQAATARHIFSETVVGQFEIATSAFLAKHKAVKSERLSLVHQYRIRFMKFRYATYAGARTRPHLGPAHLRGFVQEGAVIDDYVCYRGIA